MAPVSPPLPSSEPSLTHQVIWKMPADKSEKDWKRLWLRLRASPSLTVESSPCQPFHTVIKDANGAKSHSLSETAAVDRAQVHNGGLLLNTAVADGNRSTAPAVRVGVAGVFLVPHALGQGDHGLVGSCTTRASGEPPCD